MADRRNIAIEVTKMQPHPYVAAKVRFTALDGWRGILACLIALCHLNVYGHLYESWVLRHAYLLVDVFFVLSGFVLSHAYLGRVMDAPRLVLFVQKRFSRLWPLHVIMLAAFIVTETLKMFMLQGRDLATETAAFTGHTSISSILPNILLIHSLGIYDDYTWNIPSWALSVEFYTYIVFGIIAFAASRHHRPERLFGGLMIPASILCFLVIIQYSPRGIDTDVQYGIFRCIMDFGVGYVCYLVWRRLQQMEMVRQSSLLTFSILEAGSVAAFAAIMAYAVHIRIALLTPLAAATAVLVFAFGKGVFSRLLDTPFLQRLGKYSFCIYIIHVFIVLNIINRPVYMLEKFANLQLSRTITAAATDLFPQSSKVIVLFGQWQADILTLVYLGIVIALSAIAYNLIETPCARALDRLFNRASPSGTAKGQLPKGPTHAPVS